MLVRAGHGGIGAERPVLALGLIAVGPQPVQDLLPGPVTRPEAKVKTRVARILAKLPLRDRVQAVVLAHETGLVSPGADG